MSESTVRLLDEGTVRAIFRSHREWRWICATEHPTRSRQRCDLPIGHGGPHDYGTSEWEDDA